MRIGFICPSLPPNERPDGIGDYTRLLAAALAKRGNHVTIWTRASHAGEREEGPVRVTPLTDRWNLASLKKIGDMAREAGMEVLDIQYSPALYPPGAFLAFLPLWMRVTRARTVVVTSFHTLIGSSLSSRLKGFFLSKVCGGVIATNEEITYLLRKYAPGVLDKVREIPIGANIEPVNEPRAAVRSRLGLPEECPLLVHFGQFYPGKGVETLLRAAADLAGGGLRFKLVLIGGHLKEAEAYWKDLQGMSADLGVEERVLWTGVLGEREVAEWLAAADLYVVPYDGGASTRRGSLMAGLAAGLPVVTTHPRIPSRYFRDGENVALVPAGEAGALADRIRDLLEAPLLREKLGEGALRLSGGFAWDRIAEQTEAYFSELTGKVDR